METFLGIDLAALLRAVGLAGLFAIVFAESGLLIGFFLPGDSLLFTAGFLASQGYFNIWTLIIGCFAAAVLGDNAGYAFGSRVGPRIFQRPESLLFNPRNLAWARAFYADHGKRALVLARFLPVIRTFAPILAGVGAMAWRDFFAYNVIGGALWAIGIPLVGYFLGRVVPGVDRFLLPIVLAVITVSVLPSLFHLLSDRSRIAYLGAQFKRALERFFS